MSPPSSSLTSFPTTLPALSPPTDPIATLPGPLYQLPNHSTVYFLIHHINWSIQWQNWCQTGFYTFFSQIGEKGGPGSGPGDKKGDPKGTQIQEKVL